MSPIEEFRAVHGATWQGLINSQVWKDAKVAMLLSGPNANMPALSHEFLTANGTAFASFVKGFNTAMAMLETLGLRGESADPSVEEADYSDNILEPQQTTKPAKRNRSK